MKSFEKEPVYHLSKVSSNAGVSRDKLSKTGVGEQR